MTLRHSNYRTGAIVPLFAILMPALIILCFFAINIVYMQLTRSELRVATDSAARAAGRAWSEKQSIKEAKKFAVLAASANTVAGKPLRLRTANRHNEIQFGITNRSSEFGRYEFSQENTNAVSNGSVPANAIRIVGKRDSGSKGNAVDLLFGGIGSTSTFSPTMTAVSTQLDRDIVLVLDISGSMLLHTDSPRNGYNSCNLWALEEMEIYKEQGGYNPETDSWASQEFKFKFEEMKKFQTEYTAYLLAKRTTPKQLPVVPHNCRWKSVVKGVNAMLDILEETDQDELVAVVTFNGSASIRMDLTLDYQAIREWADGFHIGGSTNLAVGPAKAHKVFTGDKTRAFAQKTVIDMTDGFSVNVMTESELDTAIDSLVAINVVIHTIAVSRRSDTETMQEIAQRGNGKYFHAVTEPEIINAFEEIAASSPTVLTE